MISRRAFPFMSALFALAVALSFSTAQAQRGGRVSIDDRVKMLTDQLSLTKVQADSVRSIYQSSEKERNEIFQAHRDDRDAMRSLMMKHSAEVDAKIDSLLTADQRTTFAKLRKERQGMMGGPKSRRPGQRE